MIRFLMIIFISLFLSSLSFAADCRNKGECISCHKEYASVLQSKMATKADEKEFIKHSLNMFDTEFGNKNCSGCHVSSCSDCHKENSDGSVKKPQVSDCLVCHNDVYTGVEYAGQGLREDNERYKRGPQFMGSHYMQMLPDVHYELGLTCGDCHSMANIIGKEKARSCLSCHEYNTHIIDHSIKGHDKLECVSCHGAWQPMELGTFYIRTRESDFRQYFDGIRELNDEYLKSSFMRVNEVPILAIDNETGKYTPIKPAFITFTTDIYRNYVVGIENRPLSNRWKTTTAHTVRRETPLCTSCHGNHRRFMLEKDDVLQPDKDGLPFKSFYNSQGFTLDGGRFVTEDEMKKINEKSTEYVKKYFQKVEQVRGLINNSH